MTTWIALLRGINVGGKNLLPMKDLVASLEGIGCRNVSTYIQSGNVVFEKGMVQARQLCTRISQAILKKHGFEPKVLLLKLEELEDAVRCNPYPDAEADPKTLHLLFLSDEPESLDQDALEAIAADSEAFSLVNNVFYLHAPDGIGRSKLAAKAEKLLGVEGTSRNWRTVSKILEIASKAR